MGIDQTALVRLLEDLLFIFPGQPPDVVPLEVVGVRGRVTPLSHPLANLVGTAPQAERVSDTTIEDVVEVFRSQNKAFGWVTGPSSPPGLGHQLLTHRFAKIEELVGMVRTALAKPIVTRPGVRVVEVDSDRQRAFRALFSNAFGRSPDLAALMSEVFYFNTRQLMVRNYFAFLGNASDPVGWGSTLYLPNASVVWLAGAATLKEFRHRGIYRGLVARRLADAQEDGAEAAILQAARSTVAPICEKMGFTEIGRQSIYTWEPDVPA